MARISQREELAELVSKLDAAEKVMNSELREEWAMRLENWRGKYWKSEEMSGHRGAVNMTWGITNLMMAALYFRDPAIHVEAKRPNVPVDPRITERLLNYYIRELKLGRQFKRAIKDALLFDAGYLKLGYQYETSPELEAIMDDSGKILVKPDTQELLLKNDEGDIYIERDGKYIQMMDKDGELVAAEQEKPSLLEFIRKDQPFAIRWPTLDVLRDPEARYADLSDSSFVGFRSIIPLEQVKNNPSYKNTQDLEATKQVREELIQTMGSYEIDRKNVDTERVEIVEVWHRKFNDRKQRYDIWQSVIARGHDSFLLHRVSPYLIDTFPCEVLYFDEDPERPYGHSPLRAIDSQIEAMNLARAQQLTMADQQIQRTIYNGQFISDEEAQRIANMPQGGVVKLDNVPGDVPLANIWHAVPLPQISQDVYLVYDRARDEIQILFGLNEYMMGGTQGPRRQATEAGLIQQGFAVRVEEKRVAVANMVENTVAFFAGVLRQFGTYTDVFKITNELGEEQWHQFQVSDAVSDELDYRVDAFESMFQARETQVKEAQDRLNLLAPLAQIMPINVMRLVEDVLRAEGKDPSAYFTQPQPQPQMPPPGTQPPGEASGNGGPFQSLRRSGQMMDVEAFREPAAVGAGSEGRAIG